MAEIAGAVREARGAGGADDPQQHHGVDAASLDSHHPELADRRPHVQRRRRRRRRHRRFQQQQRRRRRAPPRRAAGGGHDERAGAVGQVLRDPGVLPGGVPPQRAVHPVLQPRERASERARAAAAAAAAEDRRVRHRHDQPRQLLLVAGRARLLLLLPGLPLALRAHPHVRRVRRAGLRALLPRRVQGLGAGGGGEGGGRRRRPWTTTPSLY